MAKAVSAIELAKEISAKPATFRYYLRKNWTDRQKYQRWLFTRTQADKIKAAYKRSLKYGSSREQPTGNGSLSRDGEQLRLKIKTDQ
jgi:hypothetical protein